MTYQDDNINDEMADLLDLEDNDTIEEKQQYKSFEKWLKKTIMPRGRPME